MKNKLQQFNSILVEGISHEDLSDVLYNRLQFRYPDIIDKYGYDAVENATSDVASFHAGAEELGTSDIGIMIREVMKQLESSQMGDGVDQTPGVRTKYRATVEYGPTAADAKFVTVTAGSTEEAEAKVKAWCKKKRVYNPMVTINGADLPLGEDSDPCWANHKQIGMKMKNGKKVPNCVPKEGVAEGVVDDMPADIMTSSMDKLRNDAATRRFHYLQNLLKRSKNPKNTDIIKKLLAKEFPQGVAEGEYDSRKPYGVRYKVFAGREGRITTKEYWTTSSEKLEKAIKKIEALGNFYEIDGYSFPKEPQGVAEGTDKNDLQSALGLYRQYSKNHSHSEAVKYAAKVNNLDPEKFNNYIDCGKYSLKKQGVAENHLFTKKLNSEQELIEHAKLFAKTLVLEGVPVTSKNRHTVVCSTIFAQLKKTVNESAHITSGNQIIQLLQRLDQFSKLPIRIGSKVAIINSQFQGDSVELWGFTTPKTISKIYRDPSDKSIKQFEFNNDPDDVWPRTENAEYNGKFLMYSAFFGDKKSADHALTMLTLQASGDLDIRNHIAEQGVAEGYSLKKTSVSKYMEPGDPDEYTQDVNIKDTDYEIINNKTGQVVGTASWTTNDFFGPGALKITMKNGATRWLDIWEREKGNPQTAFNRFVKDPKTAKKYKEQGVAEGNILYGEEPVSWEHGGTRVTPAFRNPAIDLDSMAMSVATKLTTGKNLEKLRGMAHDSTVYRALDRYFEKHTIPETIYNRVASIVFKRINQQGVAEDWQKVNKSDKTDGMSPKAVKAYRRENPGSKLKTAVTKKPSELKAGSKDAKRRKSFCARMSGMEGPMKDEKGRPTAKAKALARWNCNESEQLDELSNEKLAQYKTAASKDASQADKKGDFKRGDKRFSGIVKATNKQFANDAKQVKESSIMKGLRTC